MPILTSLVVGLLAGESAAAGLPAELLAACHAELPDRWAEAAAADAVRGGDAEGEWWIDRGEMNGAGPAEAVLVQLPRNRSGSVRFFALRDGKVEKKKVKVEGGALTSVSVRFEPVGRGRSLVHVDGGRSGQVLLDWNGEKLQTVWKVGKSAAGDRRWFEREDLDADGHDEIVTYFQRELDIFTDEDELEESVAGTADVAQVDVTAVFRWQDGRWKKDKDLLEGLR